jgi:hypothetical protein
LPSLFCLSLDLLDSPHALFPFLTDRLAFRLDIFDASGHMPASILGVPDVLHPLPERIVPRQFGERHERDLDSTGRERYFLVQFQRAVWLHDPLEDDCGIHSSAPLCRWAQLSGRVKRYVLESRVVRPVCYSGWFVTANYTSIRSASP